MVIRRPKNLTTRTDATDVRALISLNGRLIADGVEAYAARIDDLRRQCRSLRTEFPLAEMVVEGSHVAVCFFETIQFDDHGKIAAFHDVFSGGDPVRTIR